MKIEASTVDEYIKNAPKERQEALDKLRSVILENIPDDFEEMMNYGMPGYVVPHSKYPPGYHCDPKLPLPFVNFASQKNFIAFYHMGIYANEKLLTWFKKEYSKAVPTKLDMGKSCIRFKKTEQIPFKLIGELVQRVSAEEWITIYESKFKK